MRFWSEEGDSYTSVGMSTPERAVDTISKQTMRLEMAVLTSMYFMCCGEGVVA